MANEGNIFKASLISGIRGREEKKGKRGKETGRERWWRKGKRERNVRAIN